MQHLPDQVLVHSRLQSDRPMQQSARPERSPKQQQALQHLSLHEESERRHGKYPVRRAPATHRPDR